MKNRLTNIQNTGFSTLLIVIILGGVGLSMVLALSMSNVWSIRGSMDSRTSNIARSLVNACAEISLEKIRENNAYTGTGNVTLNNNSCSYTVSNTGGSTRSITVTGTVGSIVRTLTITTSSFNPLTIQSWKEI